MVTADPDRDGARCNQGVAQRAAPSGEIAARPAAERALALKDRYTFKTEMDDAARMAMFPHLGKKVA